MKTVIGYVLIAIGVIGGASTGMRFLADRGENPSYAFGRAVGGMIFSLGAIGGGFLLARSGAKEES